MGGVRIRSSLRAHESYTECHSGGRQRDPGRPDMHQQRGVLAATRPPENRIVSASPLRDSVSENIK